MEFVKFPGWKFAQSMSVLSILRNEKARRWAGLQWIFIHTECYESLPIDLETVSGDELTQTHTHKHIHTHTHTHTRTDLSVFIIRGGKEAENYL